MMSQDEEWKPHPWHTNVNVSSRGRVSVNGHYDARLPAQDDRGYRRIRRLGKCYGVHVLVWETFYGPIPGGTTIDHKDRDRGNNSIDNLRAATPQEQRGNQRKSVTRRDARPLYVWREDGAFQGKKFDSASQAQKELGVAARSLRATAKGLQRNAMGYYACFIENANMSLKAEDEQFRCFGNLRVSQYGRMIDPKTGAYAITPKETRGNAYVHVQVAGKKYMFHRVVAAAFPELVLGVPGPDKTIDHLDRNRENNAAANLAWKTASEQAHNRVYNNRRRASETTPCPVLHVFAPVQN